MAANWLDSAVSFFAPASAARRVKARAVYEAVRGYDGAALGRRTDGWNTRATSADAEIAMSGPKLRDRMRDLVRNNAHAAKAVAVLVNNIVGDGIVPRAASSDENLNKLVNELFAKWSKQCDADGQLDYYGMQTLICREMIESGDAIARRRLRRPEDGLDIPVQIQVVEADLLDPIRTGPLPSGNYAVQGVEFDSIGRRVAYWMYAYHPGNSFVVANPLSAIQSKPIPASEIAHIYEKQRTQVRGVPWGSPAMRTLRDLDDYETAELVRKKTEACVVGFVTPGDDSYDTSIAPSVVDSNGVTVEKFEPGLIAYLRGGKDIKFNTPSANGSYEAYKRACLRTVAAGWRIPYELLSSDLSGVNYSSIRAGLVEFRRLVSASQWQLFIPMFCQPTWDWFCEAAYLARLIPVRHIPCEWAPPKFVAVDPLKDATADLLAIRTGTRTLAEVIAEHGRNPDDVINEIAAMNAKTDSLGLVLDSDPRKVAKTGAMQTADSPGVNAKTD